MVEGISELGFKQELGRIHRDNQSAIHLSKNQMFHERTKHIDVRLHFIREVFASKQVVFASKQVEIKKIHADDNPADMLTKALPSTKFKHCLNLAQISGN